MGIDEELLKKIYRVCKDGMTLECFADRLNVSLNEAKGLIELCSIYEMNVSLEMIDGRLIVCKTRRKADRKIIEKNALDNLTHTQFGVLSDPHLGNKKQQLHLLNDFYAEGHNRGIKTFLNDGDLVDGNYTSIRKEQFRNNFLIGFDEQVGYVVDMYPLIAGTITYTVFGSHDESHDKNGGASVGEWVSRCRPDIVCLGQDFASLKINGLNICMDHPGGGSAKALSYKLQDRIDQLEVPCDFLSAGHYHKSYYVVYRNVHGLLVPAFCARTQFQGKNGLWNVVGGYYVDVFSDKNGVVYFLPEEVLYKPEDMWDEAGKDKHRVKQLVIK